MMSPIPPMPRLDGLDNLMAAVCLEADYQQTRALEGNRWTRERHRDWIRILWTIHHSRGVSQ